jgi:hypothetical protein
MLWQIGVTHALVCTPSRTVSMPNVPYTEGAQGQQAENDTDTGLDVHLG